MTPEAVAGMLDRAGWTEARHEQLQRLLAADDGPNTCPSCGAEPNEFRPATAGERLTWFCTLCNASGPAEALLLVRELHRLQFAS